MKRHKRQGGSGRWAGRAGAVQMEYVILALLVAAACVVAVVVFSRAIAKQFMTSASGASLQHSAAQEDLQQRQKDVTKQGEQAKQYHDSMHK